MEPTLPGYHAGPSPSAFSAPPGGRSHILQITAALCGAGLVIFMILTVVGFSSAQHSQSTLNSAKAAAYLSGKSDQQQADKAAAQAASESPYRNYTASSVYGSFQINFPKNWNAYVVENEGGSTQVSLLLNPDLVKQLIGSGADNTYATTVQLVARTAADYLAQFQSLIKAGKLQSDSATVAGIAATSLTGRYDDKHSGRVVVVPVRDKSMVFTTVGHTYDNEFNSILAQAKINP